MPKAKQQIKKKSISPVAKPKQTIVQQNSLNIKWVVALLSLIVITYIVYTPALKNSLTGWDDKNYIIENKLIHKLNADVISKLFSVKEGSIMGNYHPITMLSYAMEYDYAKLNPKVYHTTNIVLHLINVLLVFLFIRMLSRKNPIAFITALLFAIHPMHVESVAWVAERKDLLYVLFELCALIAYLHYIGDTKKRKVFYLFSILLFVASVLSKAMAVSMAVILPIIDYYYGRKIINTKVILEKVPFFIISIIFGLIAVEAQKSIKAINIIDYSFYDRILFAAFGFITYIWKSIIPINLSCFYDYPVKGTYSWYIVYVIISIALGFIVYKSLKYSKIVLFGMLFFLFSVLLILQIIPVGGAIIADRYTYVAYIGLFFIFAHGIMYIWENKSKNIQTIKPLIGIVLSIFIIFMLVSTYNRTKVWKDTLSIWNDALEKYPSTIKGYNGRGDAYNELKQYELAIKDLDKAIEMKQDYTDAYYNRGISYYFIGQQAQSSGNNELAIKYYYQAIHDNSMAIKFNPELAIAYYNRSGNYYTIGKADSALTDALKAQSLGMEVDSLYIKTLRRQIKK